jgi:hypothetical protein
LSTIRRNLLPLAILLLLPIAMLAPALEPGKALLPAALLGNQLPWKTMSAFPSPPPWNPLQFDGIAQFYPWRLFAARTLQSGFLPLWNPFQFCGTPFLANDQSAILYPPNLIFWLLPTATAFGVSAVAHLYLTGLLLYGFLRNRVAAAPALAGAIVWQLCAWQISWLALPTFLCCSAWFPAALIQIDRIRETPNAARGMTLGAILGLMLLAGHMQVGLYGLVLAAAYGITIAASRQSRDRVWKIAGAFAIAFGVMLLLFAPQLLPTLELARVGHRAGGAHASLAGYSGYIATRLHWAGLVTLFSPAFYGRSTDYWFYTNYAENACFVSIGALVLSSIAAVGLWHGEHGLQVRFFAVAAVAAMLVALGTPAAGLLYFLVPGFAATGSPARILVIWALGAAVLTAYGLDRLRSTAPPRAAIWMSAALMGGPLAVAVLFVQNLGPEFVAKIGRADLAESLAMAALVFVAVSLAGKPKWSGRAQVALIALIAADLLRAGFGYNLAAGAGQIYPDTPAIAYLRARAADGRIAVVNARNLVYAGPGVLPPNAATVYGLRDVQGYDSLQTGQYKAFVNAIDGVDSSPLENGNMTLTYAAGAEAAAIADEAAAKWIVSGSPIDGIGPPAASDAGLYVYAEPGRTVPRVSTRTRTGAVPLVAPVDVLEDDPTRLAVRTSFAGDLVVADQWYPGWKASVDGKPAPIREAPAVFRTVDNVPAGATVIMRYEPDSLRVGLYMLMAGVLALAGRAAGSAATRRRDQTG